MATFRITNKETGRVSVCIRKKNLKICATFGNEKDAKLWANWKEDVADQIRNFNPPKDELITLEDAIDIKLNEFDPSSRNYKDILYLKRTFNNILDKPLSYLCYENMSQEWDRLMSENITVGGVKSNGSGREKLPSPITILKKIVLLNSVVNCLIAKKISIVNNIQPFITHIRKTINERQ